MKKTALFIILALASTYYCQAQNSQTGKSNNKESFEEFRNRIMNNYNQFRKTILDHYADFLNGEWHEYESLNGLKRDETPKPEVAPSINIPTSPSAVKPTKKPVQPETPVVAEKPAEKPKQPETPVVTEKPTEKPKQPETPVVAEKPAEKPKQPETPVVAEKPVEKPKQPETPVVAEKPTEKPKQPETPLVAEKPAEKPKQPETPVVAEKPVTAPKTPTVNKGFEFNFYEIPLTMQDVDFNIASGLYNPADFAKQWKNLEAEKIADKLVPQIKKEVKKLGLNDYLTYKYIESYVNSKFPNTKDSSKLALVHYLLANLGFDARIAVTEKGTPIILMPFKQTVYGKTYLSLNNKKYYIFPPEGYDVATLFSEKVMTCQLPSDVNTGEEFDLVLGELKIPEKPKKFDIEYGPLHLQGSMNENLIPILYKYPQMPIEDYAKSNLQPQLRKDITAQIKSQLGGMQGDEGVEALLHFTQNAFEYATDDAYHGFEKPYFIEETLFYPKNDCEDRAIFYTYFLHNALGREAQLVSFPGHEAATVTLLEPKKGVSYRQDGKTFYISDPTYIGASTGMIMPSYTNIIPEVDYTYQ